MFLHLKLFIYKIDFNTEIPKIYILTQVYLNLKSGYTASVLSFLVLILTFHSIQMWSMTQPEQFPILSHHRAMSLVMSTQVKQRLYVTIHQSSCLISMSFYFSYFSFLFYELSMILFYFL